MMNNMYRKIVVFLLSVGIGLFIIPRSTFAAVSFELVPPSGALSRGQEVTFTINIDTGGESVTSIQTGMTYVATALEYVSSAAGAAMNDVQVDTSQGTGRLLFTGTNNAGFTGNDVFATVVFKIIATESGSTELCTLWQPETSPTPTPPPVCNGTCTTSSDCPSNLYCYVPSGATTGYCRMQACPEQVSCVCPGPTSPPPPVPTALPTSGFEIPQNTGMIVGVLFLLTSGGIFLYSRKNTYHTPHTAKHPKHKHS